MADEPHTQLECRSLPYYHHTALYPLIDACQRTFQFQAEDTPEAKRAKLERALSQYRFAREETVPLFASLLSVPLPADQYPPLHMTPQRQRQKTLETLVALLLALAEAQPVLCIIEDLHWLDPSTHDLLALLLDQVPTSRMLTLCTCRPPYHPPWGSRSYLTQVTLTRLSRPQIAKMVTRVAGGKRLPAEVLAQIVEKTEKILTSQNPRWFSQVTSILGLAYALSGRITEAVPLAEQAVETSMGTRYSVSRLARDLSQAYLLAGRLEDATHQALHAPEIARDREQRNG